MPGPVPKKKELRQRRNKEATAAKIIEKPFNGIPSLDNLPWKRRRKWRPETRAFWDDVRESSMARQGEFIQVDLHGLYILADLIDQYWRQSASKDGPLPALATEIRLQRQCFGLTPIDRRRLQWSVEKGEAAEARSAKRRETNRKIRTYKIDPRTVLESAN